MSKWIDKNDVKYGRGIEFTFEAIVELIRQRFPNLTAWEVMKAMPAVDVSDQVSVVGFYWSMIGAPEEMASLDRFNQETPRPNKMRRIGQGAPIPTALVSADALTRWDGEPRCGYMVQGPPVGHNSEEHHWFQCTLKYGHVERHDHNSYMASDADLERINRAESSAK